MSLGLEVGTMMMNSDEILSPEEDGGSLYIMPDGRIVALSESAINMISEMGEGALDDHTVTQSVDDQNNPNSHVSNKHEDKNTILVSGASVETLLLGNVESTENLRLGIDENIDTGQVHGDLNIDDFIETITSYRCKACFYTNENRNMLLAHVREKHRKNETSSTEIISEIMDKGQEIADCEIEVCPEQSINGLSIIVNETDNKSTIKHDAMSLDNANVTITKKISDPRLGTHYRIFVQNENREMFVCGQCSDCFDSQERILSHLGQLDCFTPICSKCNVDFSASVSDRIEYLKHIEICSPDPGKQNSSTSESAGRSSQLCQNNLENSIDKFCSDDKLVTGNDKRRKILELEADFEMRTLECPVKSCMFVFKHNEQLSYHINCHVEETNDFKCVECDSKFDKWKDLATHLWKVHAIDCDMLLCGHCRNYRTMYPKILESHNQTHQNLKLFKCDVCDKRFNQISQLKNHAVIHIDKSISEVPSWAKPKQCDICQKMFSDSKSLKKHVQAIHSKLKPYICQVCGHQSARKAMLQLHVRQHTGEKPFSCDQCDYRTGDHNSLRRHKRRHTGDKPYKCPYCQYAAIQSSSFKSHLKSKHPERPQVDLKGDHVEGGGTILDINNAMLLPGVVLVDLDEKKVKSITSIKKKDGNVLNETSDDISTAEIVSGIQIAGSS